MKLLKSRKGLWVFIIIPIFLINSCSNEGEEPEALPNVTTFTASDIGDNSVTIEGSVAGTNVTSRGMVINTEGDPSIENNEQITSEGEGEGSFSSELSNLNPNTEYFFKAFATNSAGTAYGSERSFTTQEGIITVVLDSVTAVSPTSIMAYATITGSAVESKGIIIGDDSGITLSDGIKYGESAGAGKIEILIDDLIDETTYFVKAYAISSSGTNLSQPIEVKTLSVPFQAQAATIENITITSADLSATVTGNEVLMKGFIYGLDQELSFANNDFTENGSGEASFSSSLTELIPDTEYFVISYGISATDTVYSELSNFQTDLIPLSITIPAVSDINSNSFNAETIVEGSRILEAGFVYGFSDNPDLANSTKIVGENVANTVTANITELNSSTEYFIRSFVRSETDTIYSERLSVTTTAPLATISTAAITSVTSSTAQGGGEVTDEGNSTVTARGLVWSESSKPTISSTGKSTDGSGLGSFTTSLTGLTEETTYFVRAYATNSEGTAYGNEVSFTTEVQKSIPTVTSRSITEIAFTTATGGGEVTSDGNAAITARGMVWSTSSNPTVALSTKTANGTGTGTFTSSLTGLSSNTTYFVRAYATNSEGTAYGNEASFTTETETSLPSVSTSSVTNVDLTTATGGGEVTSDGNATITARGVVWSTSSNPTVALSTKTVNGTGTGSFTSSLTGLSSNTTYFYRAYATNSEGTAYGNQRSFITNIAVGTLFRGGMVAYVFVSGDVGYVAGQNHGIIVTLNDQSTGTTKSTATSLANNLSINGYSDWSLPSSVDAENICSNKNVLNTALNNNGGSSLVGTEYWTRSSTFQGWPLLINFGNCSFLADDIGNLTARVRSMRKF